MKGPVNRLKEEKVMTLHPQGKKGVNIFKRRYDVISDFIIKTVIREKRNSFSGTNKITEAKLKNKFDGKIVWYMVTVKLALEARKIIDRVPKTSLHKLRLCK